MSFYGSFMGNYHLIILFSGPLMSIMFKKRKCKMGILCIMPTYCKTIKTFCNVILWLATLIEFQFITVDMG